MAPGEQGVSGGPRAGGAQAGRARSGRVRLHGLPRRTGPGDRQGRRARRRALLARADDPGAVRLRRLRALPHARSACPNQAQLQRGAALRSSARLPGLPSRRRPRRHAPARRRGRHGRPGPVAASAPPATTPTGTTSTCEQRATAATAGPWKTVVRPDRATTDRAAIDVVPGHRASAPRRWSRPRRCSTRSAAAAATRSAASAATTARI